MQPQVGTAALEFAWVQDRFGAALALDHAAVVAKADPTFGEQPVDREWPGVGLFVVEQQDRPVLHRQRQVAFGAGRADRQAAGGVGRGLAVQQLDRDGFALGLEPCPAVDPFLVCGLQEREDRRFRRSRRGRDQLPALDLAALAGEARQGSRVHGHRWRTVDHQQQHRVGVGPDAGFRVFRDGAASRRRRVQGRAAVIAVDQDPTHLCTPRVADRVMDVELVQDRVQRWFGERGVVAPVGDDQQVELGGDRSGDGNRGAVGSLEADHERGDPEDQQRHNGGDDGSRAAAVRRSPQMPVENQPEDRGGDEQAEPDRKAAAVEQVGDEVEYDIEADSASSASSKPPRTRTTAISSLGSQPHWGQVRRRTMTPTAIGTRRSIASARPSRPRMTTAPIATRSHHFFTSSQITRLLYDPSSNTLSSVNGGVIGGRLGDEVARRPWSGGAGPCGNGRTHHHPGLRSGSCRPQPVFLVSHRRSR